jgi:uncharacterized protein with PIN domain
MNDREKLFACDAMLGSLARWLRAAGYDAFWQADIDDWDLVRRALREGRVLLSSDTGIFRIGIVRDGEVSALLVPHGLDRRGQLAWVLNRLHLQLREPRCMACGGPLRTATREQVRGRVPERTFAWIDTYEECERCGQVFWQGTHWRHITEELQAAVSARETAVPPRRG